MLFQIAGETNKEAALPAKKTVETIRSVSVQCINKLAQINKDL